ncbi:hypothetical protein DEO72_LG6g1204 [Vigna unguiculata]|uniref:Uncharacterized protein n=1 Tax=Vigna unguiculata TaxID=3917 RepID=A0A4D6M741_VIGUN|nr:hypothetical protein DEO72_LG6g1204 [Vigna unguiculata]
MEKMVVCSRWLAVAAETEHAICGCRFVVALCGEDGGANGGRWWRSARVAAEMEHAICGGTPAS